MGQISKSHEKRLRSKDNDLLLAPLWKILERLAEEILTAEDLFGADSVIQSMPNDSSGAW